MSFIKKLKWLLSGNDIPADKDNGEGVASIRNPQNPTDQQQEMTEEEFVKTLLTHPIFTELREWSEYRSKVLAIQDPIKRNMAKYYVELFFSSFREAVRKMVIEHDVYLEDTIALNNLIIDTIDDVRKNALAGGVPEVFLDKFTHYLYAQTKILDSTYRDLDNFKYYNTPIAKASFRLDLEFLTIRNITSEVESVINSMNGELHMALEGSVFDN